MEGPSVSTEAAAAPAPQSASDKLTAFEEFLGPDEEDQDDTQPQDEGGDPETDDDLDLEDEEAGEDGEEPAKPAIQPPASLNAEEKSVFAQLPPEAQQAWAASETRRNAQVQEATTKASEAQRVAEAKAAQANADAKALYAQQLGEFVKAFEPQAPDPRLAYENPAQYIAEKAQYDAHKAQHDDLVQQVRGLRTEADTEADQAFIAQRDRELMAIPEVANPETRKDYLDRAMGVAAELGFDQSELAANATARDIQALARIADWRAKAERLDKAMANKMQKVRAAKQTRSQKPGAAPHASKARSDGQAWQRVKGAASKEAQAEAFADFMGL